MRTNIGLLSGGKSVEREVSIRSAKQCALALKTLGYNVIEIDADDRLIENLMNNPLDVVFNALHGRWGEDGIIQGFLEWLQIPYTHSGVLASAISMNKHKAREIFEFHGLPIANGFLIESKKLKYGHPLEVPYVLKPNNEGSSVGVKIIDEQFSKSDTFDQSLPDLLLVEEFIPGKELTVTVMGGQSLEVTEIETTDWYDFSAKYDIGGSSHITPAQIPADVRKACLDYASAAYNAVGCRGISRVDFRWNNNLGVNGLVILEINTQPGMTKTSLVPEQAISCNITFEALCKWIVEDASCDR